MTEPMPETRRVYATLRRVPGGRARLAFSVIPPAEGMGDILVGLLVRGVIPDGVAVEVDLASNVAEDPEVQKLRGAALLASVTLVQTAAAALLAGVRMLTAPVPAAAGMVKGEPLIALPTARVPGVVLHDAVALSATEVSIGLTAPALAIGGRLSVPVKLVRLTL